MNAAVPLIFIGCLAFIRCPEDSTVQYHNEAKRKGLHRFSLQAFQFVNAPDPFVYIHCQVIYISAKLFRLLSF